MIYARRLLSSFPTGSQEDLREHPARGDPGCARGRGCFRVIDVTSRPPVIAGTATSDDTFVRTADGWRIKPRSLGAPWPSGRGRTPVPGGDWLADACG